MDDQLTAFDSFPEHLSLYKTADTNPALVYIASLSESSRRKIRHSLNLIADIATGGLCDDAKIMPWHSLRYQHVMVIRAELAVIGGSPATANRHLSALRGVLKEAWRLGYMDAESYQRAIDFKPIQGGDTTAQAEKGRSLSVGEFKALMDVCAADDGPTGDRDAAIIALAYVCGLRRSEIADLTMDSLDLDTYTLTIVGKRTKRRVCPIEDEGAIGALNDWLALRGLGEGPLFKATRKGGTILDSGVTDQAIYYIVQNRAEEAGVYDFTPHDLRRTFAGDLLDSGVDLVTVQRLMGHSNPATTAGYDRRGERAKRKAVSNLHVPWQRRR